MKVLTKPQESQKHTGDSDPDGREDSILASETRRRRRPGWILGAQFAIVVLALAIWQVGSGRMFDPFFVSSPTAIATQWWQWVVDGTLWYNAISTFYSAMIGFLIGAFVALLLGYLLGGSPRLGAIFEPFITAIYSLPKLALVPLFVMWLGIGRELQVLICALIVFFLMFYNTYFGVREVDQNLIDAVRIMGGGRMQIALGVRLPSALIWVVAGLKIAIPQAIVGVVVAEILASDRGLGHLVALNAGNFNSAGTFAALLTLLVLGVVLERFSGLLTKNALKWKSSDSSRTGGN